ncbi:MAG: dTDP-4-dehydrorhamnose reductase [Terracidiphilus sp.]
MSGRHQVLIVGAAGQVGWELQRSFADAGDVIAQDRTTVDLAVPEQLRKAVREAKPDVILNAAAYTAVDRAESEPEMAIAVNATAPRILAEEADRANALLVHYSTDYVFDGSKAGPWLETDAVHPLNAYGASKLAGERAIAEVGGKFLILRTSWVYGPRGNNFLCTMLRLGRERESLKIVDDQVGAPTSSIELARATRRIAGQILAGACDPKDGWPGIYHMTCAGSVTWCGFAKAIFERGTALLDGKKPQVQPIPTSAYPTPAQRPRNSVLSSEKLWARFGVRLQEWESALDEVMLRLAEIET